MHLYFQKKTLFLWKYLMKHLIFGIFIAYDDFNNNSSYFEKFGDNLFADILIVIKICPQKDLIFFHVLFPFITEQPNIEIRS